MTEKEGKERANDFTQGSIVGKMLRFMIPILGALVLQAMYGAVDILVVGWFGTTAGISGVSTGSNIINLVVFVVTGLSMGVTVLIGRYIGEKKENRIGKVIEMCIRDSRKYCHISQTVKQLYKELNNECAHL